MKTTWRRTLVAAAVCLAAAGASLVAATPAEAQPVTSGSIAFSGDTGDYITGGGSYAYTAGVDSLSVFSDGASTVNVRVSGANGDWWFLDFDAPEGQSLVPATYPDATRFPFNGAGPGLSLDGNGRGCNTLTGSFTVLAATFGPHGYVETFDATFEQHCEGGEAAARGEVHIANPPAPPELALELGVAAQGTADTVNGAATVSGTVTCTKPAAVNLSGTVVQVAKKSLTSGSFTAQVDCTPGAPAAWSAQAAPFGPTPFRKGPAEATANAEAVDTDYGVSITDDATAVVSLRKARP